MTWETMIFIVIKKKKKYIYIYSAKPSLNDYLKCPFTR